MAIVKMATARRRMMSRQRLLLFAFGLLLSMSYDTYSSNF
jgi:hypothetical protein